jgi:phage terminase small subunit
MTKKRTSTSVEPESEEHGPAMRGLTERQRNFVMAALADPEGNPTDWARLSGYTDNGKTGIRVLAHRLMRDPRIEAAIVEIARSHFTTGGAALAANNLLRIARNEKHPNIMMRPSPS